ncbi:homoserine kinase [Salinicola sp. DM10]|uniref:homoserine kinase n=1 Tax=Salinicola sp. DM10 TaxID=2815721 RepID=UPI001A8C5FC3|nr:homoserine kinase [Salinicola sp. DM10]MCE3028558.1 homoserine kinase [Salinicola sp. DM10]
MAVFTPLDDAQVADFLTRYTVGDFVALKGVPQGTENSTFFVTTDQGEWVLTLFEQGEFEDLPFFVDLLDYLDAQGLPVPGPVHDRQGVALQRLAGRPALLFPRMPGSHPSAPNLAQCAALGDALGRMHQVSQRFTGQRDNPRNLAWLERRHREVLPHLDSRDQALMREEITAYAAAFTDAELPRGAIHGDLFRDNTLYDGDRLGGIIDFYNGCTGELLFDLAIVINDWTSDAAGEIDRARYDAILGAYLAHRPLSAAERALWPLMLRMTALRYWLSRLLVIHVDPPAHDITPHDPARFRTLLMRRLEGVVPPLPA